MCLTGAGASYDLPRTIEVRLTNMGEMGQQNAIDPKTGSLFQNVTLFSDKNHPK